MGKIFNNQIVNQFNHALIDLRDAATNKIVYGNENSDNVTTIVEERL